MAKVEMLEAEALARSVKSLAREDLGLVPNSS